jgi:hypothetical protein
MPINLRAFYFIKLADILEKRAKNAEEQSSKMKKGR